MGWGWTGLGWTLATNRSRSQGVEPTDLVASDWDWPPTRLNEDGTPPGTEMVTGLVEGQSLLSECSHPMYPPFRRRIVATGAPGVGLARRHRRRGRHRRWLRAGRLQPYTAVFASPSRF